MNQQAVEAFVFLAAGGAGFGAVIFFIVLGAVSALALGGWISDRLDQRR